MYVVTSLLAGLVFGLGPIVSGMANPARVPGFLDFAGRWDPSFALVMAGAIAVGFLAFAVARTRTRSFVGIDMKLSTARHIDQRLIVGGLFFGMGWGIAGFCPGSGNGCTGHGRKQGCYLCRGHACRHGRF